jgi:dTDP-4-dehydrorhamnose 3,5-epimerase
MKTLAAEIPGLMLLQPPVFHDLRGSFTKVFHEESFRAAGLPFSPREEFFTVSRKGVLRGMHFQLPPAAQDKVVFCPRGRALDVVLDLRRASPTFGRHFSRELSGTNLELIFIPAGLAHGFLALEDDTTLFYLASQAHSPAHDSGVLWNSFGFDWPVSEPILSTRDQDFNTLPQFVSPF